jgi:hypothetical protein
MPRHQERTGAALARGPAKAEDIQRARHDARRAEPAAVRVQRRLEEVEATSASLRDEIDAIEGVLPAGDRVRPAVALRSGLRRRPASPARGRLKRVRDERPCRYAAADVSVQVPSVANAIATGHAAAAVVGDISGAPPARTV